MTEIRVSLGLARVLGEWQEGPWMADARPSRHAYRRSLLDASRSVPSLRLIHQTPLDMCAGRARLWNQLL